MTATRKVTSGLAAKTATTDAAVEVIAAQAHSQAYRHCRIVNEGAVAGFYSIDGGTTWERLPASTALTDDGVYINNQAVQIKRVAGGGSGNPSGVFGSIW